MRRAIAVALALGLSGCCFEFDRWATPGPRRPIYLRPTERPYHPLAPTPPLQVFIGVPPAVAVTVPLLPQSLEYEPLTPPWDDAVWVAEHWDWDWSGEAGWQWLRGRFIPRPGPGYAWNPPELIIHEGMTWFVPGFFCAPAEPADCVASDARYERPPRRGAQACPLGGPRAARAVALRAPLVPSGSALVRR
jgi:hypothetical protein